MNPIAPGQSGTTPYMADPAPAQQHQHSIRELGFQFEGNTQEYFRIWIVNVALSILTLGVFSAWAKVRTKQYFYRHTSVDGRSFDYLADPRRILKGRLIIAAVLGTVAVSQYYSPAVYGALVVVLVILTPWVVVKALAFNARNSAYRNIRFTFQGTVGEAYGTYLLSMLVQGASCGAGYPFAQWQMTRFFVQNHLYGDERVEWKTEMAEFFKIFLMAFAITLPLMLLSFGTLGLAGAFGKSSAGAGASSFGYVGLFIFYASLLLPAAFTRAKLANAVYGGMLIGGRHQLQSNQRPLELLKIYVTNILGIVFSLGLLIPWAKIRLARYRAQTLTLLAFGPLEASNYELARGAGVMGDAAVDLGDYDFDLGI